jgi:hypothetical protein
MGADAPQACPPWRLEMIDIPTWIASLLLAMILASWIVGVVRLFQKRRHILGWIALAGLVIPFLAPIGFAGFFVKPNPQVSMRPSD